MPPHRCTSEVFWTFLRLGLTSFGGPIAHLGYFREEFVVRRGWMGERAYADLVALCQFLPGPASSQVGMGIGLQRAGWRGALAAWLGFTLPSALLMLAIALGLEHASARVPAGLLHGLKLAAVAVVIQAVWGMGRQLCRGPARLALMLAAAATALYWASPATQIVVIAASALLGGLLLRPRPGTTPADASETPAAPRAGIAPWLWLVLFAALLLGLPWLAQASGNTAAQMAAIFFRAGALVFGGGHVVMPLLQESVVAGGHIGADTFLAGYGAAQAMPGPLFTFAAFLGALWPTAPQSMAGSALALACIFAPGWMLLAAALPWWERLKRYTAAQMALAGINAAVVGLLLAALWNPLWTSSVHGAADVAVVAVAGAALMKLKLPPWVVVLGCALAGWVLA
ncbi:chromate efflux transporter [Comamonas humi]